MLGKRVSFLLYKVFSIFIIVTLTFLAPQNVSAPSQATFNIGLSASHPFNQLLPVQGEFVHNAALAATSSITIYDDALAPGWRLWSCGSTVNLANTSPVQSGSDSISVTFTETYADLCLHNSAGQSLAGMTSLQFYIDGGSAGNQQLKVYAIDTSGASLPRAPINQYIQGGAIPANSWGLVSIPLTALGLGANPLTDVIIQDALGKIQPTFYVDSMQLVGSASATPTNTLAPTSTPTPTSPPAATPTLTATPSNTPVSPTNTPTQTPTNTPVPLTNTPTNTLTITPVPPTNTPTAITASPTSTPVNTPVAPASITIYDDNLATGWLLWSCGSTVILNNTSPVQSGSNSMSVTFNDPYSDLCLHHTMPGQSLTGMTTLQFYINGGSTGNQQIKVYADDSSGASLPHVSLNQYLQGGAVAANSWQFVSIPLSALGLGNYLLTDLILQDTLSTGQPTFYLDNMQLTGSGAIPPTNTPVATPTPASTPTPTPTPSTATPMPTPTPTPSVPTPTPTQNPNAQILLAAGDIANCDTNYDAATANIINGIPGTVLTLGDNAYYYGSPSDYANCYDPTWGQFKARTHPAPGNHDYFTDGAAGYYGYFGAAAGDPSKGYYSFDLGSWHLIALNSNCDQIGGCGAGSPEEQWLRADLAAHPTQCTLAYWHHPLFSSGMNGGSSFMQPIWQALYDYGADVVLNGHDHDYERFAPQDPNGNADPTHGIREFVVGTGGGESYPTNTPKPNSEVLAGSIFGVLKLTLNPTGYSWQFLSISGETFTDSGSQSCH